MTTTSGIPVFEEIMGKIGSIIPKLKLTKPKWKVAQEIKAKTTTIPKPVLRGYHVRYMRRGIIQAFIVSIGSGLLFKYNVADKRKANILNAEKHFFPDDQRMKILIECGMMQSYPKRDDPDRVRRTLKKYGIIE